MNHDNSRSYQSPDLTGKVEWIERELAAERKEREDAEKDYAALNCDYKSALDMLEDQRKAREAAEAQVKVLREAMPTKAETNTLIEALVHSDGDRFWRARADAALAKVNALAALSATEAKRGEE